MGKFALVLCVLVLGGTYFGTSSAGAQTLNVGLTIAPAGVGDRSAPIGRPSNKISGNIRIKEYASPGYATRQKLRTRTSQLALK
ncbi:hypothetical protein [Phyllobacterium lublinensis]|uniref:hypothetical protein n=1 Tax=Phyllobacterium lublinensis TaxID=2875708 RepID=UPI001CCF57E3|nr:hypothetical protein [Phyllobacterium sp. 2063]MBZ9654325.1 hypothetical protein [Phyllobacterium sp. 2063]